MTDRPIFEALKRLGEGYDLTVDQASAAVAEIMGGGTAEVEIAAFLTALRIKGEIADELAGAVRAARDHMTPWNGPDLPLLDTCGTGGDGACMLNVSTAAAIVVAATGVPVAKHGNRSASGNSGSAEVLTELGINIEAEPTVLYRCLSELGITFLFAPRFHPALRFAAPVRRRLPFRTLFNLVGPLANPARPRYQLVGVTSLRLADLVAKTLASLGIERAAIVTSLALEGEDGGRGCSIEDASGIDEVALDRPTRVRWVEAGRVRSEVWTGADFGLLPAEIAELRVSGPTESAHRIRKLLWGEPGPARNVVLANAAAALRVAGRVETLAQGVILAAEAIDTGSAARLVERWAALSQQVPTSS